MALPVSGPAPFFFAFNGCDAFVFQPEDEVTPYGTESYETFRSLYITFPDGNQLLFKDIENTYPDDFSTDAEEQFGNLSSAILGDMTEWGLITGQSYINVDITQLKADIATYPEMFIDSDGDATPFAYDLFPSGVYKVRYYIRYEEPGSGGGSGGPNPTDDVADNIAVSWQTTTTYYYSTCALDACFLSKLDTYFETRCDEDENPCREYKQQRDMLKDIIILKEAANIDYAAEKYTDANEKWIGAYNLCTTGVCSYKHGC